MLWICLGCSAAYSVGAPRCPQCGGDDHVDQGGEPPVADVVAESEADEPQL